MNFQATIKFVIVSVRLILPDIAGQLWLPDLPCHHGKATSDREMIFISPQRNKGGNGDYCSHFSVTLETPGKFIIVFISVILGKIGIDGVTGSRREIGIRDESDLKVILKDSR